MDARELFVVTGAQVYTYVVCISTPMRQFSLLQRIEPSPRFVYLQPFSVCRWLRFKAPQRNLNLLPCFTRFYLYSMYAGRVCAKKNILYAQSYLIVLKFQIPSCVHEFCPGRPSAECARA